MRRGREREEEEEEEEPPNKTRRRDGNGPAAGEGGGTFRIWLLTAGFCPKPAFCSPWQGRKSGVQGVPVPWCLGTSPGVVLGVRAQHLEASVPGTGQGVA